MPWPPSPRPQQRRLARQEQGQQRVGSGPAATRRRSQSCKERPSRCRRSAGPWWRCSLLWRPAAGHNSSSRGNRRKGCDGNKLLLRPRRAGQQ